jgi:restriction endonuclease Mrr
LASITDRTRNITPSKPGTGFGSTPSTRSAGGCEDLTDYVVFIDGVQLAHYMIEFGVGVSDVETIRIKQGLLWSGLRVKP